ncbi:uncharacterized protein CC84DRAFT_1169979 [Paraphaeosphaeria sporulosa]|uniref:SRR1-like domain-containing protein n=1 Tax=Paraphaeosphaeria sporulosa TaxID=1460663 RepID=A0A177BVN7_9PLEO|nr:uncharacterized protein CC84DRAFT_1169979 [Paraphaeosphaeria sporulosa]OAF98607.1 hypothetical protein CC84DRAFT_1169979 [Paraphaeosphaeria sporulosa]
MDLEYFTIRLIDGTEACIKNPMFIERCLIWRPHVTYREYWRLIYHCLYLSASYCLLWSRLKEVFSVRMVAKIICFGLGDMCRGPLEWYRRTIQHSVALTMADMCTKEMLKGKGFLIIRPFRAGGFTEIKDDSIIFSAFADLESPCMKKMWDEYKRYDFLVLPEDVELLKSVS